MVVEQSFSRSGIVSDTTLIYQKDAQEITIPIGSPSWYAWLEQAQSFSFKSDEGTFTANKARSSNRRGGWYWYAYRRRHGQLFRSYLGSSSKLTLDRLHATARQLALRSEASGNKPLTSTASSILSFTSHPTPFKIEKTLYTERASSELPIRSSERKQNALLALLATKFHIPRLPTPYITRSRLHDTLDQGVEARLTLVTAPVGSGKTTLLAAWARTTTIPVAWLSLEEADNDPQRFLAYLIAALKHFDAQNNKQDMVPLQIVQEYSWEEMLTSLVNELAQTLNKKTVLILDDYQFITSESIHAMLRFLLEHAPQSLHLLIGTRNEPPLPLARLRARGQFREIDAGMLRFCSTEVQTFLHSMDLNLSTEALHALEEQTQGWVVGIHLLSLALRNHADPASLLQTHPGVHRFFQEYISEEILAHQTAPVREFLVYTSILKRLTGPLCEAVTGQSDGSTRLAELHRKNLLVHMLDDTGIWYGYHPLFAEGLRAYLHKQDAELVSELYCRASFWYEQQHWNEEACEYAFLAGDLSRAATLLAEHVPLLIAQRKVTRLRQWLTQLPPTFIDNSPQLWLASVWIKCGGGNMETIITAIKQQIELHAQEAESSWADLHNELALFQAWTALYQDDLPQTISLIHNTVHARPSPVGALSHLIAVHQKIALSDAYRAGGNLDAAELVLLEAAHANENGAERLLNLLAQVSLAELYTSWGQLHKLDNLYQKMLQTIPPHGCASIPFLALTQARYATLLYERNRLKEAETTAQQAMEIAQRLDLPTAHFSLLCLWILVRIALAQGHDERVTYLLERTKCSLTQWQIPEQSTLLWDTIPTQSIPARLALTCNQLEQAERWETIHSIRVDTLPNAHLSSRDYDNYVTLARILLARGRRQRNSILFTQTITLLEHLRDTIKRHGYHGWHMEIELLTVLALQAQGKTKFALKRLGPLLAQAESAGYMRLFADEGQPIALLLAQVTPYTSASPGYIQEIQNAIHPTHHMFSDPPQQQALLDPLSVREQEVLHLLATGSSNQQIATALVISLHTVKLHVKHILAKFSVTNRTQAVARARELQML